jgi:hypothetical protein
LAKRRLEGAGFGSESEVGVEALVKDCGGVARACGQFRVGPFGKSWKMLLAETIDRLDEVKIEANLAQPDVLLLHGWAHLFGGAGQQLKMIGLDLLGRKTDSSLQAFGERLCRDRDPHRAPLADRELHQSGDRNSENEKGKHRVARETVSARGRKSTIEQRY